MCYANTNARFSTFFNWYIGRRIFFANCLRRDNLKTFSVLRQLTFDGRSDGA
jgi:hypothetical protein